MSLTRNQLLLAGTLVIVLFYFLYRTNTFLKSSVAEGEVIAFKKHELQESLFYHPVISFKTPAGIVAFWGDSTLTTLSIGDRVTVIYRDSDPQAAGVYSFETFWFGQLVYCIVPLAVWGAFVLSFIDKEGRTRLRLKLLEREKKERDDSQFPVK